jgi:hypothetical protein
MTGPDDEFDQFLARRRPVFRRPTDDQLEPPDNVDRLVLRQARDAIKPAQAEHLYRGPGWGVPLAVAATLVVCLTMVLHVVMPQKAATPGAATRQVAHEIDAAPAARAATNSSADEIDAPSNNPPSETGGAAPAQATVADAGTRTPANARPAAPASAGARAAPAAAAPWRGDSHSWLAAIDRLRAEGKTAEADAEMALYKRQHRAYAGSPDR